MEQTTNGGSFYNEQGRPHDTEQTGLWGKGGTGRSSSKMREETNKKGAHHMMGKDVKK